ncbi:MAG: type II toxin-antitoxin system RelE/ParE family toxin [Sulfuricurvum sp.]|nr:type II toxin-antitoxin system RelE/ParE family toxin [Sulfuricurvum sp.]
MIISFADQATSDIFNGIESKQARKRLPLELWKSANRKLDQIDSIVALDELKVPPGNRLEKLRGNREDQMSIRINDQYRICFTWSDTGAINVEIIDYHS